MRELVRPLRCGTATPATHGKRGGLQVDPHHVDPGLKALGCQPVEQYIPLSKVVVSDCQPDTPTPRCRKVGHLRGARAAQVKIINKGTIGGF